MPHQRRRGTRFLFALMLALWGTTASTQTPPAAPPAESTASGEGGWLAGTVGQKFDTVAKQLRGFDMAMVETGYRYTELYWAAQDSNWGYAEYQALKIRTAIDNGLERRPRRGASAQAFLNSALPSVLDAIKRRDAAKLKERVRSLTAACNNCHVAEKVEFVQVGEPQTRTMPALTPPGLR